MGGMAAISDPILGMKLSRKATSPHSTGKSTPRIASAAVINPPVTRETMV